MFRSGCQGTTICVPLGSVASYHRYADVRLHIPMTHRTIRRYKTPGMQTDVNGMITFLDESIGNITNVIKSEGLWDNMLIVFSADNGGYLGNGGDVRDNIDR